MPFDLTRENAVKPRLLFVIVALAADSTVFAVSSTRPKPVLPTSVCPPTTTPLFVIVAFAAVVAFEKPIDPATLLICAWSAEELFRNATAGPGAPLTVGSMLITALPALLDCQNRRATGDEVDATLMLALPAMAESKNSTIPCCSRIEIVAFAAVLF